MVACRRRWHRLVPAFAAGRNLSFTIDRTGHQAGSGGWDIAQASKSLQRRCAILGQSRAGRLAEGCVGSTDDVDGPRALRKA